MCDQRFLPVFGPAADAGLAVMVHAFKPLYPCTHGPPVGPAIALPNEIGMTTLGLIAAGIDTIARGGRIAVSHGGGGALLELTRLHSMWSTNPAIRSRLAHDPLVVARSLFYDSVVFAPAALKYVLATAGDGQVIVASDDDDTTRPRLRASCTLILIERNAS